jgi:hypothetical protein
MPVAKDIFDVLAIHNSLPAPRSRFPSVYRSQPSSIDEMRVHVVHALLTPQLITGTHDGNEFQLSFEDVDLLHKRRRNRPACETHYK